jgi:protein SCO1
VRILGHSTATKEDRMKRPLAALIGILVIGLFIGLGVLGYRQFGPQAAAAPDIGGAFRLVDGKTGKTVTDEDFRGRFMLVYFGYTHCPDACPTALNDIAVALGKLGDQRAKVAPIFITVDPERDNGPTMADYVKSFGPDFLGLTGSTSQILIAERAYRVYAAKHPTTGSDYDMDHSSIIYLMDPNGKFIANFTHETSTDEIAAKLQAVLQQSA